MTTPSLHAQALARIEEEISHWRKDIELFSDIIPDSEADQLAKTELSAWLALKEIAELHDRHNKCCDGCGIEGDCNGCDNKFPCPTRSIIEKMREGR